MFELSTTIINADHLEQGDYTAYDALYLGDFSCPALPGNFSSDMQQTAAAVAALKAQGKKCYLRIHAVPSNCDLDDVTRVIEAAQAMELDALEVHNLGVLRMLRQMDNRLPVHLGVFGNLYTHETARVLKDFGVVRVYPNPELSLKEIVYIQNETPIDVLVPVHGKMPLVISETCFILENACGDNVDCSTACGSEHWLHRTKGEWSLKDTGRMTLSGKDLCMVEHLNAMIDAGLSLFHVQNLGENAAYAGRVGRVYRAALEAAQSRGQAQYDAWREELGELSRMGLCNGYYFESAGQHYVGRS